MKRKMVVVFSIFMSFTILFTMCGVKLEAGTAITSNQIGTIDGFQYELWKDKGTTSMTLNDGAGFSCQWGDAGDVIFREGTNLNETSTYQEIGDISLHYDCNFQPNGSSYLAVNGWSKNPLVEYFIIENHNDWKVPEKAEWMGTITVDDGTYEIYKFLRNTGPSIVGTNNFLQYFSVRTTKRSSGTVSVSEHFKAWESKGMNMGMMKDVTLMVEAFSGDGKADVTDLDIDIADTAVLTPTPTPTPIIITDSNEIKINGYDYKLWKDYGTTAMTINDGDGFSCRWSDVGNALFSEGKIFDGSRTHKQIGDISVSYDCNYQPDGDSNLAAYGWTMNPMVEYYIVENWSSLKSPASTFSSMGTVTVDGDTYDIYQTKITDPTSCVGAKTLNQYWSVRRTKRTSGTVSVSEHFKAWENLGAVMGKMYSVSFLVEGIKSSGRTDVNHVSVNIANTPSLTPTPTLPSIIKYGDVNGDDIVDSADYTILRSYLLKKIDKLPNIKAADMNGDGKIDSADYTFLRKYLLKVVGLKR